MGAQGGIKRWLTSLRARVLILFWLVALVPLVTLAILDARATRAALTEASYRSLVAVAAQTASRVDQFFTTNLEVIATESALPILAEYLVAAGSTRQDPRSRARAVETLASFAVKDRIFISSSALLDLRGRNVIDTAPASVGEDESERPYFRETLETNLPHASLMLFQRDDGKPSLYFSSPVRDAQGQVAGVLRTKYNAAALQQLVIQDSELVGSMAFPLLVDDDQILLAHGAASDIRVADFLFKPTAPLSPERLEALRAARRLPPGFLGAPAPAAPEDLLAPLSEARIRLEAQLAFQGSGRWAVAVQRLSQMPWSVVFVQPEHVFLAPVKENTRSTVRLALACAALVALIALGVARLLAQPIEHLTQVARRIAAGEFGTRIRIGGGGEIGLLADSFDHMAAQVQQRERALRERAEELARSQLESQNKTQILESILNSMSDGVVVADEAGRFLLWNDAATRILGRGAMDIPPSEWPERYGLCLPDRITPFPQEQLPLVRALRGESVDGSELFVRHTRQELGAWISVSARPLRSDGAHVHGGVAVFNDITERKRAEEERTRLVEQLRDAVRSRDEFLAIASHELRTPLTPLKVQVQSLRRYLQRSDVSTLPPGRVDQVLASFDRQVDRLNALIENLLDVSRLTRGQLHLSFEDVDLSELVSEVVERFRPEIAAAGSSIELCLGADLVGRWDRTRIEQVFTNLLTNALKYAGGAPIKVVTEPHAGTARLIVQDRGMGIAPEHHQRIFQPFERAVSYLNISGFGLGLYIIHQIVEAHRGSIRLESEPGRGAIFTVDLPLRPGSSDSRDEGAEAASPG
jgi:PAS domain S-box-containing protein